MKFFQRKPLGYLAASLLAAYALLSTARWFQPSLFRIDHVNVVLLLGAATLVLWLSKSEQH